MTTLQNLVASIDEIWSGLTDEGRWGYIRAARNRELSACDWTQVADSPLTFDQRAAWAEYRQALRDLTEAATPESVVFPEVPNG